MPGTAYQEEIIKTPGLKKARYGTLMMSEDANGNAVFVGNGSPIPVQTSPAASTDYESKALQPGTSADGYNVTSTGGMFGTVTTSISTTIKNRAGNSGVVSVYLKADNSNPIALAPGEAIIVDNLEITNLYLDTDGSFGAAENVDIILFG